MVIQPMVSSGVKPWFEKVVQTSWPHTFLSRKDCGIAQVVTIQSQLYRQGAVSKYNLEQTSRLLPTKLCVKIQHCKLTYGVYLACSMLHREIHEQRARCCNRGSACTRFTHGVVAGAGNSRNPSLRMLAWKNGSHMATKRMWDETVSVGVDYQDVEERSGLIWGKRENFFSVTWLKWKECLAPGSLCYGL